MVSSVRARFEEIVRSVSGTMWRFIACNQCVQWNWLEWWGRSGYLARNKPGAQRGGDIASNTSSQADLTQLRASETLGSLPGLPQTRTLRPRRYRAVLRGWAFHPIL